MAFQNRAERPWKKWYDSARWRRARAAFLRRYPVAVDIFGEHKGQLRAAEVIDHIVPHRGDPVLFWDQANWQGLTKSDHDRKTALEDGGFGHVKPAPKPLSAVERALAKVAGRSM